MKMREFPNVHRFLTMMFEFFIEYSIEDVLEGIDDYPAMLEGLLDSDFADCLHQTYKSYTIGSCLDFKLNHVQREPRHVHMLMFGDGTQRSNYLLLDLVNPDWSIPSFLRLSVNFQELPPFFLDFLDEVGALSSGDPENPQRCLSKDDILSFEDFAAFLAANTKQGKIINIDVD